MKDFWKTVRAGLSDSLKALGRTTPGPAAGAAELPPDFAARLRRAERWGLGLLALFALIHALLAGSMISGAYIDVGDGNYLYTSSRMADGLVIYRDFLSPQPPMHLLAGSLLQRLGRLYGAPLETVRAFSILLQIVIMAWVYLIARRLSQSPWGGAAAAGLYLLLPIGFWWSLGYQSEPLELCFLLGAWFLFLALERGPMALAGALMALAVLTNMTAAPYALAAGFYLAVRHPRRLLAWYALPLVLVWAAVALYFELRTGAFFLNTITNQVGSYPEGAAFWPYVAHKLVSQGSKILSLDGGFILLGLLGALAYNRSDTRPEREFTVWFGLALFLSFVYVTKGGTADYIFCLGEPAVAVFAGCFLAQFFYPSTFRRLLAQSPWRDTGIVAQVALMALMALVVCFPALYFHGQTLRGQQFELSEEQTKKLGYYIQRHSHPGDTILAHPFLAWRYDRLQAEEYSELFLWTLKYQLERSKGRIGEGVHKVSLIARALEERALPVVVANVNPANLQLLRPPEIREAIDRHYRPLLEDDDVIRGMNFQFQVFVPREGDSRR